MWAPLALVLGLALSSASAETTESWGYHLNNTEELGPEKWAEQFPSCGGTHQSPINFDGVRDGCLTQAVPIQYIGDCKQFTLKTLEDVLRWEIRSSNTCKVVIHPNTNDSKTYTLAQFHVHTPSEHTVGGKHLDGEIHFVHKEDNNGTGILVTGLLLQAAETAADNAWLSNVWSTMGSGNESTPVPTDFSVNYADMLNALAYSSRWFNYPGSLTTPPCSEIVNWWVINNPLQISTSAFERLQQQIKERPASSEDGYNNRPVQPLNDRKVTVY